MTRDEIFRAFTPPDEPWSRWVKPVLFAAAHPYLRTPPRASGWVESNVLEPLDSSRTYRSGHPLKDTMFVVDLPGARSVEVASALTQHGIRPVPLFNAIPHAEGLVDMRPISQALSDVVPLLDSIPAGAPPAFLLDADRRGAGRAVRVGVFDNRSICRASDFPSVDTLKSAGIQRAVLVCVKPQPDLVPILYRWQKAGIALWLAGPDRLAASVDLTQRFVLLRIMDALRWAAFHENADGSFGKMVVQSS